MAQAMSIDKLRDQINAYPAGMIDGAPPGTQPKAYAIADRICKYCEENKLASPYGTVFDPFHFNIQVSCAWSSDTAREYFETHIRTVAQVQDAEANGKGEDSVWEKPGTLAFQLAAAALLSSKFIVSRLADSQLQLYQVHDWQAREVAAVTGKADDVNVVIARAVVDTLEQARRRGHRREARVDAHGVPVQGQAAAAAAIARPAGRR